WTSKSTLVSACTAPNRLLMLRSCSTGVSVEVTTVVSLCGVRGRVRQQRTLPYSRSGDRGYLIPASAQAFAKSAVQTSLAFQKPSAMTVSLTLALVTAMGISRMLGTSILPLFTLAAAWGGVEAAS